MSHRRFSPRPEIRSRHAGDRRRAGSRPPRPASDTQPHRRAAGAVRRPARRSPACSPSRNARRRRSNGAAPISRAARPRALVVNSGNANAFTGKTGRAAPASSPRKIAAKRHRLQAGRHLPRLDRRDRRAAQRHGVRRRDGRHGRAAREAGRWLDAAKAIMTTDTFPKVATAKAKIGKADRHHQRHRQGRRHDRARHGDDAVVRLHRRADRARARCRRC